MDKSYLKEGLLVSFPKLARTTTAVLPKASELRTARKVAWMIKAWTLFELFWTFYWVIKAEWSEGLEQIGAAILAGGFVVITSIDDYHFRLYSKKRMGILWSQSWENRGMCYDIIALTAAVWLGGLITGRAWHVPVENFVAKKYMYLLWAVLQQFLVESYMFVRLEKLFGPKKACRAIALLFAAAHCPNWPLTFIALIGGYASALIFNRYRNLYILAFLHGMMGAAIPTFWKISMRVGLSYVHKFRKY